jgi:hypothetical protein
MFANTQMMGTDMGFPDVCMVPTPAGPVPTPFPNIGMGPTAVPSQVNVLMSFAPAHNMATTIPLSNGDNAGVAMGVASGTVMGPVRHLTAAFTVLVKGAPGTKLTSVSLGNSTNAPGARLVPSQPKVLLLSP